MKKVYHLDADQVPEKMIIMGDPQRVQMVSSILKDPVLISKSRDLFVYKGYYNDKEVGLATHGMGGPSAAIIIEELIKLGAKILIRLGTAGSLTDEINTGDVIIPTGAYFWHGGAGLGMYFNNVCPSTSPSYDLISELIKEVKKSNLKYFLGTVFSSDSFYAEKEHINFIKNLGITGIEMECATLFALANLRKIKSACILVISNSLINDEHLDIKNSILKAAEVSLNTITKFKPDN